MTTSTNDMPSSNTPPLWQASYEKYGIRNNLDVLEDKHNLLDLLQPKIDQHSDSVAFSMGPATLTFAQLDIASRRFAAFLQAQGISKGDRVAVQLPNHIAVCRGVTWLSASRRGIGECQSDVYLL